MSLPVFDLSAVGNVCTDIIATVDEGFLARHGMKKGACTHYAEAASFHKVVEALASPLYLNGGVGANVTHVVQALGGRACFQGKAGQDDLSAAFIHELNTLGVTTHCPYPKDAEAKASQVMCLNTPDGDRTFGTYDGAGKTLSVHDLDVALIETSSLFYFDGYSSISAEAVDVFSAGHKAVHRHGGLSCFNPCDTSVINLHPEMTQQIKSTADIIICNLSEAQALFGQGSSAELARLLADVYVAGAVTDGANNAYVFHRNEIEAIPAPTTSHLPNVDSNGAGDHFAGGFLYGLTLDLPLLAAGQLGQFCALDCLSHAGARPIHHLQHLVSALTKI